MSETQAPEAENPTDANAADEAMATDSTTSDSTATDSTATEGDAEGVAEGVAEGTAMTESVDAGSTDSAEAGDEATEHEPAKADKKSRVRQLEREGEVAADFLETLLDIADLDGDIDVDVDGDRAAIAIVDSDEGRVPRRLVGADGKVLEALQELTRLAVQAETGERSRLMLDIAGHRAQRRSALVELAKVAIAEVKESGTKRSLEPMSAFERKVVHDEVAAAGLVSESEGVDPHRHIVILPA